MSKKQNVKTKKSQNNKNSRNNKKPTPSQTSVVVKVAVIAAVVIAAVVGLLYGCLPQYDVSEVPDAAAELIEASYEINTVFFGDGLPTIGYDGIDELLGDSYSALSEDSPYKSEAEIKEAALKVYTEDYCEFLFEKAFIGQNVDFTDKDDNITETVQIPARYLTYNGELIVRYVDEDEILKLNRTYDTSNVRIVKKYRKKVVIGVQAFVDGVPDGEETFTLEITPSGWRLDDPTY